MKNRGQRCVIAALLIILASNPAFAESPFCIQIGETSSKAIDYLWGIPAKHIDNLYDALRGISRASGLSPALLLCRLEILQAVSINTSEGQMVAVAAGMMRLTGGDTDELAAVLGHEFGHFIHDHGVKKWRVRQNTITQIGEELNQLLRSGMDEESAIRIAGDHALPALGRQYAFYRDTEREADDEGFTLAQRAGFQQSGQRRFAEKMMKVPGAFSEGFLADHPGWGERYGFSARLELNEDYRRKAEAQFKAKQVWLLRTTVDRWIKDIPDSGAAAYYHGLHLLMTRQVSDLVSEAFEDAVTFFDEGLSKAGQKYQSEINVATLALCVSLYREDKKVAALHCLQKLKSDEEVDLFRRVTGWTNFVLMPRSTITPRGPGNLYGSRSPEDHVILTNCPHIAQERGLKDIRPWRGLRDARDTKPPADAMVCSPDFCNCVPTDLQELISQLKQ